MITAEQARKNASDRRKVLEEKALAEAALICEKELSSNIAVASAKGVCSIVCGVTSRTMVVEYIAKILVPNGFEVEMANDGKHIRISW